MKISIHITECKLSGKNWSTNVIISKSDKYSVEGYEFDDYNDIKENAIQRGIIKIFGKYLSRVKSYI